MTVNINAYKEMLNQPWGKIMYRLIFAQLSHIKNKQVLDFGAGFGTTSEYLAKHNTVTAIEPNADMLFADDTQTFTKINGSLEVLKNLPEQSFDVIICHNVFEYIDKSLHQKYLGEFERLLKPNGELSLIKHNLTGKVLHQVIFNNNIEDALHLLEGKDSYNSSSFGRGETYSIEELTNKTNLALENYQGLRTFYALQPNAFKTEEGWLEHLTEIELAVANQKPYKDIAFLQHLTFRKH